MDVYIGATFHEGVLSLECVSMNSESASEAKAVVDLIFSQMTRGIGHAVRYAPEVNSDRDFPTGITWHRGYARFSISKDWPTDMVHKFEASVSIPLIGDAPMMESLQADAKRDGCDD